MKIHKKRSGYKVELQLALDLVNIPEAIELVKEVEPYIDVVEISTPLSLMKA